MKFKKEENITEDNEFESIKVDLESLRPIAKRQIHRLLKKIRATGNHEIYKKEIIKLIRNEKRD